MKKARDEKVEEITKKLEQGIQELFESEKYERYLKVMSKLHNYSFNNSLLIAMQKPDATMVAGFTSWKKNFHRNVKKGEKGIRILAPSPYKVNKEVDKIDPVTQQPMLGRNGEPIKEHVQVTIPAYKITTVFDVSQTEGEKIPEIATALKDEVNDFEKMFQIIEKVSPVPIVLDQINSVANGYYDLEKKVIVIKKDMSEAQTLKTAVHEISHAKLHDRDSGIEAKADRKTKEVEAESIAYTVCSHLGLDTSSYSFGYIAGWSSDKEFGELKKSMNVIQHTASELITDIDKEFLCSQEIEKGRLKEVKRKEETIKNKKEKKHHYRSH